MEFRILGPLEAYEGTDALAIHGAKRRALLAILLLHANETLSRERLIDELWGEQPPETAAKALQMHVSTLRKSLEQGGRSPRTLLTAPRGYVLSVPRGSVDLHRFEDLRADGARALADGRFADAARLLREALAMWRGPPLAEFAHEPFARAHLARLEELRLAAAEDRIRADLELGAAAAVVPELEALVAEHPLRERLRELLMLALYRSGRQADALAAYSAARQDLVDELGIEPGRALQELQRAILAQDESLEAAAAEDSVCRPAAAAGPGPPFVGRESELARLTASLRWAQHGNGRLVLLDGEAGIGKSRLADELAAAAADDGATVLWGRCWEAGGAPPYWPWVQSLRAYAREADADALRGELGPGATDIAELIPELREKLPGLPPMPVLDPEAARFRLFDAVAGFLRAAGRERPLVLVLDDVHAADAPSLLLLRYVARELAGARVLVLALFRAGEVAADSALPELTREPAVERITLGGLQRDDVARFVELTSGAASPTGAPEAILRESEGNPLFMTELVRLLVSEERLAEAAGGDRAWLTIPAGVRELIGRRLSRLPEPCRDVLSLGSVLGRDIDTDVLARAADLPAAQVLERLEPALAERLLAELPGTLGRLRFSHVLVRDVLYLDLPPARRAQAHVRCGEALVALHGDDAEPHLAELAHHFLNGRAGDRAVHYARRAGERAARLLAHEEAARLYEQALEALAGEGQDRDRERCELLALLGDVRARAGETHAAREASARAYELARRHGLVELQARAALAYGGRYVWQRTDPTARRMLEEALEAVGPADGVLRARLLARLAGASLMRAHHRPQTEEAVSIARRLGDPATTCYVLAAYCNVLWNPATSAERLAVATEIVHLAQKSGDLERLHQAHLLRMWPFLELGDIGAAEAALEAAHDLCDELRQPAQRFTTGSADAMLALLRGDFAVAERHIEETHELGRRAGIAQAETTYAIAALALRREVGGAAELEALTRRIAAEYDWNGARRAALACLLADLGRHDEARAELDRLAPDNFASVPYEDAWLVAMGMLAETCARLDHPAAARTLYPLLMPHAALNAATAVEVTTGSVERYLGLLAATAGELDAADTHFERAIAANERMGAEPFAAHARAEQARMLLSRDRPGDGERAERLLAEALAAYRRLGMDAAEARALPREPARPSAPRASAATP